MSDFDIEARPSRTIQIADDVRGRSRPTLGPRSNSRSSRKSTESSRVREPELVLPTLFKTVSMGVDESIAKNDIKSVQRQIDANGRTQKAVQTFLRMEWHALTSDQVCKELETGPDFGLTTEQVMNNVKTYGTNIHSPPPNRILHKLFMYCFGGFGALLMIGGILCCIAWKPLGEPAPAASNLVLGVVLFLIFLIQAAFNGWQDYSSSRVMSSISNMVPESTLVRRDGKITEISTKNLVPGDIVLLKAGNKVPADLRITEASNDLKFDQSILTGESKPVEGNSLTETPGSNYLEANCIALQGSYCISGNAIAVVVSTGDSTVFGNIAKMSSAPKRGLTSLQWEIFRFVLIVVSIILTLILVVIIVWAAWIRKTFPEWITVQTLIIDIVSVAVAFIPEGLPIALTTCLTIIAMAMKKNNVLCKSLSVVETLGAVSVICSDKTGTLTKNKMTVTNFSVGTYPYKIAAVETMNDSLERPNKQCLDQLQTLCSICNAAEFNHSNDNAELSLFERRIIGDATDQACLRFAEQIAPVKTTRSMWNMVYELAFNSKNKFMIRLMEPTDDSAQLSNFQIMKPKSELLLLVKGAPDILLSKCSYYVDSTDGTVKDMSEKYREQVVDLQRSWSNEGKRVILLCRKAVSKDKFNLDPRSNEFSNRVLEQVNINDMVLVGLVGISDPLKDEIPEVIDTLRNAGVRVYMVTGDYELTAVSIAKQCGIVTYHEKDVDSIDHLDRFYPIPEKRGRIPDTNYIERAIAVSGQSLITLNDNQWENLTAYTEIVFARTTPEQKLRIVKELQKRKHIVGMTGDGINDAPSLKAADVGIAMGDGSDVAIEAADLVLLDSFSSIVVALKYGRLVFENLKKTIIYLIPAGTFSELWPVLLNIFVGLPQVLSSFLMIVICCLTDCGAAMTLAYEAPEKDLLNRPPRSITGERLVNLRLLFHAYITLGTIECVCSMAMAFWFLQRNGIKFSYLDMSFGNVPEIADATFLANMENTASSIYFVTLVIMQFFNFMATRTRYLSVFQHPPLFNKETQNIRVFFAFAFAIGCIFFFCYIPWFQQVLLTTQVPVEYFFLPATFGLGLLCLEEIRKLVVRTYPKSFLARIAW